jgi:hypothetical protein
MFEVIGSDGYVYEVEGDDDDDDDDVVGEDVLGYEGPMGDYESGVEEGIVGYDEDGTALVGARRRRRRRRRRKRRVVRAKKPGWRKSQLAPGVIAPDQGLLPLPMAGSPSDTFSAAVASITFEGQVQKPFRGERLLVSVVRTGTTAVGRILGQLFVGTDLNQLDVTPFDIEQLGDPNAFGVRMAVKPCQPGVFIRLVTSLSAPVTGEDTISCYVTLLGRNIH